MCCEPGTSGTPAPHPPTLWWVHCLLPVVTPESLCVCTCVCVVCVFVCCLCLGWPVRYGVHSFDWSIVAATAVLNCQASSSELIAYYWQGLPLLQSAALPSSSPESQVESLKYENSKLKVALASRSVGAGWGVGLGGWPV